MDELLSPIEMAEADRRTIAAGVQGLALMQRAADAVADAIGQRFACQPVLVICGPGNNGGDGYGIAARLRQRGWPVTVAANRPPRGSDAQAMAVAWGDTVLPLTAVLTQPRSGPTLVVDALYGAGLDRPLGADDADLLRRAADRTVVAVDVPSGLDGATGAVDPATPLAALTVTFARAKPGHLLLPGRGHCRPLVVADIGIPDAVIGSVGPKARALARATTPLPPRPDAASHKYSRGAVLVVAGDMPGAAILAAEAARRAGAGYVATTRQAAGPPGLVSQPLDQALAARRWHALVIGPGGGQASAGQVPRCLAARIPLVVDAEAIDAVLPHLPAPALAPIVLTPHEGEFRRCFAHLTGSKLTRARAAAAATGAVVVLKGADTVIARPDGTAWVQGDAPASLATAGSGDCLAGVVAAMLARGMGADAAARLGVLVHSAAGALRQDLVADDLPDMIGQVLAEWR